MATRTVRTYATFEIRWNRGSTWSGYDSAVEAQATLDRSPDAGEVVARFFDVELAPRLAAAGMYQPGISDREVTA